MEGLKYGSRMRVVIGRGGRVPGEISDVQERSAAAPEPLHAAPQALAHCWLGRLLAGHGPQGRSLGWSLPPTPFCVLLLERALLLESLCVVDVLGAWGAAQCCAKRACVCVCLVKALFVFSTVLRCCNLSPRIRNRATRARYIPEYTGEMITHAEADYRGVTNYDSDDFTCLFDLSQDTVLDAGTAGSKAKFANHSHLHPNASSRIMQVRCVVACTV